MKFKQIYILYSNLQKKLGIRFFLKKLIHKCLFKIPLWREIDNVTFYFLISSKTLKIVYLSFHGFNDSRTRGFKLVTRGFEIDFWILTRAFQLSTRNSQLLTRVLPYYLQQYPFLKKGFRFSENLFQSWSMENAQNVQNLK